MLLLLFSRNLLHKIISLAIAMVNLYEYINKDLLSSKVNILVVVPILKKFKNLREKINFFNIFIYSIKLKCNWQIDSFGIAITIFQIQCLCVCVVYNWNKNCVETYTSIVFFNRIIHYDSIHLDNKCRCVCTR